MTDPTLKTQITEDMKAAMKARDAVRVGALRMFLAAIKMKEVEGTSARQLSDEEVREIASKQVKKHTDSIEAFDAAGRTELSEKERAERAVLEDYAPPQLDDAAVDALVDEAIAATGATSMKEMGAVMGMVMGNAKGQIDGNVVRAKVQDRLGA